MSKKSTQQPRRASRPTPEPESVARLLGALSLAGDAAEEVLRDLQGHTCRPLDFFGDCCELCQIERHANGLAYQLDLGWGLIWPQTKNRGEAEQYQLVKD